MADGNNQRLRSSEIWKQRSSNSGVGSRGDLAKYKIDFINNFIKENNIKNMIDFGCGDLQIASRLEVEEYLGVDIVEHKHPNNIKSDKFETIVCRFDKLPRIEKAELCTCLDVFYHILSDEKKYLETAIQEIVNHSSKFIIIYAQDSYRSEFNNWRGHMNNSPWRQIMEKYKLSLLFEQEEPQRGSSAKFFVYEIN